MTPASTRGRGLVCDVGGTNCRFALIGDEEMTLLSPVSYPCAQFTGLIEAAAFFLSAQPSGKRIEWALVAVAGPIDGDCVTLTNSGWRISARAVAARLKIAHVRLVNDFSAMAASLAYLEGSHLLAIGGGAAREMDGVKTLGVIGPGTGLGVGGVVISNKRATILATEGGHSTFAPTNNREREIERVLARRFERVSNERLLCGEGLCNIHHALSVIDGVTPEELAPRDITRRAAEKSDPQSMETLEVFSAALGAFSGDVVLTLGARAGLYIAGGMISAIIDVFDRAAFRAQFEAKGRFRGYMEATPTWIIVHAYPGLVGAAALAKEGGQAAG